MSDSLVSIIIPCYNAEKYVAEAIQSALDQTYPNCEVIVIDDGSTDRSLEVIKSFGDKIRWETGVNRGGCAARNRGIECARGEWIQFLDADDRISAEKIEKQLAGLKCLPVDSVATCGWRHFTDSESFPISPRSYWKNHASGADLLIEMWLNGGFFCQHCWLVPRHLMDRVGPWSEELSADQDGEFFGRVLAMASAVVFTPGIEVYYRKPGPSNVSVNITSRALESRFKAWDSVQRQILTKRNDREARRAVLRQLRSVAYHARHSSEVVEKTHLREKELWMWDWNPRAPLRFRVVAWAFGLKAALTLRNALRS